MQYKRGLKEQAEGLISIAHSDDRAELKREWSTVMSKAKHGELS